MGDVSLEEAQRRVLGGQGPEGGAMTVTTDGEGERTEAGAMAVAMELPSSHEDSEGPFVLKGGFGGAGETGITTTEASSSLRTHAVCEVVPVNPTDPVTSLARRRALVDALLHQPFCTVPEPAVLSGFTTLDHLKGEWQARGLHAAWHHSSIVDIWGVFRQPLLTQDLQMLAVAVMSVSRDLEAAVELLQVRTPPPSPFPPTPLILPSPLIFLHPPFHSFTHSHHPPPPPYYQLLPTLSTL